MRSISIAKRIMTEFADSTGISNVEESPRRYLWTDAFAVCNFQELYRQTGNESWRQLALRLVDQVHAVLGRHREDDTSCQNGAHGLKALARFPADEDIQGSRCHAVGSFLSVRLDDDDRIITVSVRILDVSVGLPVIFPSYSINEIAKLVLTISRKLEAGLVVPAL